MAKFSELKFGVISSLLSLLGIEPEAIEKLKKDALKKAIQDNINNFEQNEYNLELLTIFKKSKIDSGRTKVLTELRKQLIKQMTLFGEPDFYSKTKIYSIKQEQVSKILGDLLEEKQNLIVYKELPMTDISISDIERISHAELDRKIEQISFYINRVQQRMNAIKNFSTPIKKTPPKLHKKLTEQMDSSTIKVKK